MTADPSGLHFPLGKGKIKLRETEKRGRAPRGTPSCQLALCQLIFLFSQLRMGWQAAARASFSACASARSLPRVVK